ncbi:MAG: ABC transporter permease [Pikeienuella sp.]
MKRPRSLDLAVTLCVIFACAMMVLPNAVIIPASFGGSDYIIFPPQSYSTKWYERFLTDPAWRNATWNSVVTAFFTMLGASAVGTMAALGLSRLPLRFRSLAMSLFLLPTILPTIVTAVALYGFLSWIGGRGGIAAIVLGHVIITMPFVIVNVVASLQQMDRRLEDAARSLGAGPLRCFVLVTLPMIWPGIAAGAVFAFLTSFSEIVLSLFLSSGPTMTLPVQMWSGIRFEINPTVAAASTVFVLLSCAVVGLMGLLRRRQARGAS